MYLYPRGCMRNCIATAAYYERVCVAPRLCVSLQERSALLSGFGFTTEGFLALTSLQGQAEEHKAKKTRVGAAICAVFSPLLPPLVAPPHTHSRAHVDDAVFDVISCLLHLLPSRSTRH